MGTVTYRGKTLQEWYTGYQELACHFILYANHAPVCRSHSDPHEHKNDPRWKDDTRKVCSEYLCTCGLIGVLSEINTTIEYVIPMPSFRAGFRLVNTELHNAQDNGWCLYRDEVQCLLARTEGKQSDCQKRHHVPAPHNKHHKAGVPYCSMPSSQECMSYAHRQGYPPCILRHKTP